MPEAGILESNQLFKYRPAAEAFLSSQPTVLSTMPSLARPGQTLETSTVFPLADNYSGGTKPPPTPAAEAYNHPATCSHTECLHFRQVIKRSNYNASTSLAITRSTNLLGLE